MEKLLQSDSASVEPDPSDANTTGTNNKALVMAGPAHGLSEERLSVLIAQQVKAQMALLSGLPYGPDPVNDSDRRTHEMSVSESSSEEGEVHDGGDCDFDITPAQIAAMMGSVKAVTQPQTATSKPDQVCDVLGLVGKNWGQIYNNEEKFGPPVDVQIAELVNKFIRARPGEEQLNKATEDILVPENTKMLTVPLLNKEFEGKFQYSHGAVVERTSCRHIGLACKALGPLIQLLNGLHVRQDMAITQTEVLGVSNSIRLIISLVNLMNYSRKQNVLNGVREPHLKSLCSWETQVGEKTLFPENVMELLADLKKKHQVGAPKRIKKGKKVKRMFAYNHHNKYSYKQDDAGGSYPRDKYQGKGQDRKEGKSDLPFLGKRPRGKGKRP